MLNYNNRTVTVKIKRRDLVDLMIAVAQCECVSDGEKWHKLHEMLGDVLNKFDAEHMGEEL